MDTEQFKIFVNKLIVTYENMSVMDTTNYSNGALDALWAVKNFIEVNE